mgnify:CR=1 FL=1
MASRDTYKSVSVTVDKARVVIAPERVPHNSPRLAPPPRLVGLDFAPVAQTGNLSDSIQNLSNNQTKHESVILDLK